MKPMLEKCGNVTYQQATVQETHRIYEIVQCTIKAIYPRYYPSEVVDFFRNHHSLCVIAKDVQAGNVSVLKVDEEIVGTGSFLDNHITRVYVLPEHQKKGYGTYIMNEIEAVIGKSYDKACLDASLPAAGLYEKIGYKTIKHERHPVKNDVILAYEIMEKELHHVSTKRISEL